MRWVLSLRKPCRRKFSWKFAARRVDRRRLTSDELDPRRMKPERNVAPGRPEPDRGAPWTSASTVGMWSAVGNVANAARCASGLIHFPDRAAGREDEQTSSGLSIIVRADSPALLRGRCYNSPDDYVWTHDRMSACAASKSSERRIRRSWRSWNEQTLTRLLTWSVMESSESITTPRFLTCEDGVMSAPDISRGDFGQCCRDDRDPSQMTSVFVGLSRNRFEAIQPLTTSTQSERRFTIDADRRGSPWA